MTENYIRLIENINQELYDLIPDEKKDLISFVEENPPLNLRSCGYTSQISFFGLIIWCSENDERPHENEDDPVLCDYMPLEKWIWKEIKRILSVIENFGELINVTKKPCRGLTYHWDPTPHFTVPPE